MSAIRFEAARGQFAGRPEGSTRQRLSIGARRMWAMLREWRRRARDRASLGALDDRVLADIGISRADAEFLANKPFWRA